MALKGRERTQMTMPMPMPMRAMVVLVLAAVWMYQERKWDHPQGKMTKTTMSVDLEKHVGQTPLAERVWELSQS